MPQGFDDRRRRAQSVQPPRAAGVRRLPAALDRVLRRVSRSDRSRTGRRPAHWIVPARRSSRARRRGFAIMKRLIFLAPLAFAALTAGLVAQQPPASAPAADPDKKDEGIPVTSAL